MRAGFLFIAVLFVSCGSSETNTQNHSNANQISSQDTSPAGSAVNSIVAANERSAVSNLRAIYNAQMSYQSTTGNGYYATLNQLGEQGLVPPNIVQGVSGAYRFEINLKGESHTTYEATATPIEYGRTGRISFFVDESGVLRGADKKGQPANVNDSLIEK